MTRFWINKLAILAILLSAVTSCIKSDINFGNDMITQGYKMKTYIDTLPIVSTYQVKVDSFPANEAGSLYLGRWHSDSTGTVRASIATTYVPIGFEEDTFFGDSAVMDSMKFSINITENSQWGDSSTIMKIHVYRINGFVLNKDSTYYTNLPMKKYIDPTPLCTITTNDKSTANTYTAKLPLWYAKLHYDNRQDSSNIYVRDDKFINRINGLYIEAEPINPSERRIMGVSLGDCALRVFYHNNTVSSDTLLYQSYIFYNTSLSKYPVNIMMIDHDYATAKPEMGGVDYSVIGDTVEVQKRTYISCPNGLATRITIDTSVLNSLKDLAVLEGYNHVAILNATLRMKPVLNDYKSLDKIISTLKLYYSVSQPAFLSEYNPVMSALYSSTSNSYNSIGGTLNRTNGYYSFDITGYMQRLITGASKRPHLEVYPAYSAGLSFGETYLGGSTDPKYAPEIILTYSFIQQ